MSMVRVISSKSIPSPTNYLFLKPSMDDARSSISQGSDALLQFTELCKRELFLTEDMFSKAIRLFKETKYLLSANISAAQIGEEDEIERHWFGCILYSVIRLSEKAEIVTLSSILKVTKLSINNFSKQMENFVCTAGPILDNIYGADWEKRFEAKELQEAMTMSEGLFGTGRSNVTPIKRKLDAIGSPFSPEKGLNIGANLKMEATPVSTSFTTSEWLPTVISPIPSKPSAGLEWLLSSCDRDTINQVTRRADIILGTIFFPRSPLGSTSLMDHARGEERRLEALKLYYRVLEAVCTAEAQLVPANSLTCLLSNDCFHRCLLVCSAELILAAHRTASILFTVVLERTGITAFDLSMVVENFIRHEQSLPRELKRHLNSLEERLLVKMVWEKGSSLYNTLIVARPHLSAEINRLELLAEPIPSLDAVAMHCKTSLGRLPPLSSHYKHGTPSQNGDTRFPKRVCRAYQSVSPLKDDLLLSSPSCPNPGEGRGGKFFAERKINVLLLKILKLVAVRINGLVERLQLNKLIRETVYLLVQKLLSERTSLFFNRHIDQILLCSLYCVAKKSQLGLKFQEIICNYRKQPQCNPQVLCSVFVAQSSTIDNGGTGHEHVGIITFYNKIFVPSVKSLLDELRPATATLEHEAKNNIDGRYPQSPGVSSFPGVPDMSPKKVSAAHNVYVSPLRLSKMDNIVSHSSKSYYACFGESTHAYQSPSKDLTAINSRLNGKKANRKLNLDGASYIPDSLVIL